MTDGTLKIIDRYATAFDKNLREKLLEEAEKLKTEEDEIDFCDTLLKDMPDEK
jgi:hypothetical protein